VAYVLSPHCRYGSYHSVSTSCSDALRNIVLQRSSSRQAAMMVTIQVMAIRTSATIEILATSRPMVRPGRAVLVGI
jgi:hypothetical protein